MNSCLSVVIPAYNEERTLQNVVQKILRLECLYEVIIVNDSSSDRTPQIAEALASADPRVRVFHHSRNQGKTEALKTGFALTARSIVIVQDADLEYDVDEIPDLIQPILDGHADAVYGSRFMVRKAARVLYFYHYLANRALRFL